jgi:hypothetical protein
MRTVEPLQTVFSLEPLFFCFAVWANTRTWLRYWSINISLLVSDLCLCLSNCPQSQHKKADMPYFTQWKNVSEQRSSKNIEKINK